MSTSSASAVFPKDGFGDQPKEMNGFSNLMVHVFGDAIGKHARSALGMAGLPFNQAVEAEIIGGP
jgi:enamine deaminase RidA (YjgF/YER057c/UK114 family)